MRDVFLEVKDGKVLGCGVRCRCVCMQFRCSGQRLSRCQSAWAEERKTGMIECIGVEGETRSECLIARMCEYSIKRNAKGERRNENRAACDAVCSCYLCRGRVVAKVMPY